MNKEIYNLLPQEIKNILFISNGWVVGSSIEKLKNKEEVRDYDILITDNELFAKSISSLKSCFDKFTTFGGIKLKINNLSIDIWCQSLEDFIFKSSKRGIMFNMRKNIILNE